MYAVYVLAALLLSVAPMHATTVLAALPSATRAQRLNSTRMVRSDRIVSQSTELARPDLDFRIASQPHAIPQMLYAYRSLSLAILPSAAGELAHSPNAP